MAQAILWLPLADIQIRPEEEGDLVTLHEHREFRQIAIPPEYQAPVDIVIRYLDENQKVRSQQYVGEARWVLVVPTPEGALPPQTVGMHVTFGEADEE